jgi:hypothetical protein
MKVFIRPSVTLISQRLSIIKWAPDGTNAE